MRPELQRPRRLRAGDVVRVIAPSGPVDDPDRLTAGVQALSSWGLQVELGEHTLGRHSGYLAGTDTARIADLARAWCDPRVAAVICARGGYGLHRIVDWIDWATLRAARDGEEAPVLVGFSDATVLHEAIATKLEVVSLHGPMPATERFRQDPASREHLRRVLFGLELEAGPVTGAQVRTLTQGRASGVMVGGNLSSLAAGVGTYTAQASLAGAVVLLEDVAEDVQRIDRCLTHLLRAGVLDGIAGVAGGDWIGCGDLDQVDRLLVDRLGHLAVPMVNGLDFGHGFANRTIPLGITGALNADRGALWWSAPALR